MEIWLYLLILGLLLWFRSSVLTELKNLSREVRSLKDALAKYKKPIEEEFEAAHEPESEKIIPPEAPVTVPLWEEKIRIITEPEENPAQQKIPVVETQPAERIMVPPPPPRQSFLERYPDLEKFIGENLINKIGIAILVLGIGFFVK